MTVSTTTSVVQYNGNGSATAWPVPFRFFKNTDLVVVKRTVSNTSVPLVLNVDYTVTGANNLNGGTVTTVNALAAGELLTIARVLTVQQLTDLRNQGDYFAEIHEDVFDYLTMLIQQVTEGDSRALKHPRNSEHYQAEGRRIVDLEDPVDPQDAATLAWTQQFVSSLLGSFQGPINNSANVAYITGDGVPVSVQDGIQRRFSSVQGLIGKTGRLTNEIVTTLSFHPGWAATTQAPIGGGDFVWYPNLPKAFHNGGTVVSPTVPWNGSEAGLTAYLAGTNETAPGTNGCWVRSFGDDVLGEYFGMGFGLANEAPSLLAAAKSLGTAGGDVVLPLGKRCAIESSIEIPANITIRGNMAMVGTPGTNQAVDYSKISCLVINPTYGISLKQGSCFDGVLLYRKGITTDIVDDSSFAGTALTLTGDDAGFMNGMILGFNKAIYSNNIQRPRIENVGIDCRHGIDINICYDIAYISEVHCWPYLTIDNYTGSNKTAVQRNGEAFRFANVGDWNKVTNCFEYGWYRGYHLVNVNSMTLQGCGADSPGSFSGQISYFVEGTSTDNRIINCQSAAQSVGYYFNTAAGTHNSVTNSDCWASTSHCVLVEGSGDVTIRGGTQRDGQNGVSYNNANSTVRVGGVRFRNMAVSFINPTVPTDTGRLRIETDNDFGNGTLISTPGNLPLAQIASADPLPLPYNGDTFKVTGTTSFGTITNGWAGRQVTLLFAGALTVSDGSPIRLASNFTTTADDTLTLRSDGVNWYEVSRSVN